MHLGQPAAADTTTDIHRVLTRSHRSRGYLGLNGGRRRARVERVTAVRVDTSRPQRRPAASVPRRILNVLHRGDVREHLGVGPTNPTLPIRRPNIDKLTTLLRQLDGRANGPLMGFGSPSPAGSSLTLSLPLIGQVSALDLTTQAVRHRLVSAVETTTDVHRPGHRDSSSSWVSRRRSASVTSPRLPPIHSLGTYLAELQERTCDAHHDGSAAYFDWHWRNTFRD
jgi:hypothetical protein